MRFTKFDIGAEIIAILTRGMYPDPKDALREYIQNGVDAKAKNVTVKIRQGNIVVQDDGTGMDYTTLRKAARIGVSDKNPSKDVGFMGIGIYSAYHLCDTLTILTRGENDGPLKLTMQFAKMRSILESQRKERQNGLIEGDQIIDLQSLLESNVSITEKDELNDSVFPNRGTRVELSGVTPYFYSEICNLDKTSRYLQDVVPLHFDSEAFQFATEIESEINEACGENSNYYESISLLLQVNNESRALFKPYKDSDFNNDNVAQLHVKPIKGTDGSFYGVMWGCLNSDRRKIKNTELRGFSIKKQGFAIGRRSDAVKFFGRGNTFFDRYIGEIIITDPRILPNASRNDIEYSPLRDSFYYAVRQLAGFFDSEAEKYQEACKADDVLNSMILSLKEIYSKTEMSLQDSETLLQLYTQLSNDYNQLSQRIKEKRINSRREEETKAVNKKQEQQLKYIQNRILINQEKKSGQEGDKTITKTKGKKAPEMGTINSIHTDDIKPYFDSLIEVVNDLELRYDDSMKKLLEIIDERFIQGMAKNKDDYSLLLKSLRDELLEDN